MSITHDTDLPANSVFLVEQVRIPGLRNAIRVFGALLLGFVAMGDAGANPSSRKFRVRKVETGEVVNELSWESGEALIKDLETLTASEFAQTWVPTEVPAADEG